MGQKKVLILMLLAGLALMVTGCGSDQEAEPAATGDATQAVETTGEGAVEAVATAFETMKTEYVQTAETALVDWSGKINGLIEKKDALPELARKPLVEPLNQIAAKRDEAGDQLDKLKAAGEDTFEAEKASMEGKLGELGEAFSSVSSLF